MLGVYAKKFFSMRKTLKRMSIKPTTTSAHSPESDGFAERMNRTFLDKARAMMKQSRTPHKYQVEALNNAKYLYNRTASPVLNMRLSYESFSGKSSILSKLKVFGCQVYAHIHKANRWTKWNECTETGVHLGVDDGPYRIRMI